MNNMWSVRWTWLMVSLFLATAPTMVEGFATRPRAPTTATTTRTTRDPIMSKKSSSSAPPQREDLPTLDDPPGSIPVPLTPPYPNVNANQFYPPTYTLLRAGPVSFLRRITSGKRYEQYVWKYMKDYKDDSLMSAQGNADAFLASADDWAEQKYLEGLGRREVFDYGKPLPTERVVLSSVWGVLVTLLASRVVWQLIHGNRNLF